MTLKNAILALVSLGIFLPAFADDYVHCRLSQYQNPEMSSTLPGDIVFRPNEFDVSRDVEIEGHDYIFRYNYFGEGDLENWFYVHRVNDSDDDGDVFSYIRVKRKLFALHNWFFAPEAIIFKVGVKHTNYFELYIKCVSISLIKS